MTLPAFIEALPLSLRTFWRYLILLPFLAVGAIILSLAGLVPILGLVVAPAITTGLVMVGLRCALAARGHRNPLDIRTFVIFCLIFGTFNLLASWGLSLIFSPIVKFTGHTQNPALLILALKGTYGISPYWAGLVLTLSLVPVILACAFAVPMTAAAEAATPKGGGTGLIYGFGSGLFSLLIISAVWLVGGNFFSMFGEIWTSFGLLIAALHAWIEGESLPWTISLNPLTAFGGTMFMTWASSWYFATAVIAWERKVAADRSGRAQRADESRPTSANLRDLRKKRMQGDRA